MFTTRIAPACVQQAIAPPPGSATPFRHTPRFIDTNLIGGPDLKATTQLIWASVNAHVPRKLREVSKYLSVLEVLLANCTAALNAGSAEIVLPRSKSSMDARSRYKNPDWTHQRVTTTLSILKDAGLIIETIGTGEQIAYHDALGRLQFARQATTIRPTAALAALLSGTATAELDHRPDTEVIALRDLKGHQGNSAAKEVEYRDTCETRRMRDEIRLINSHIRQHPVSYSGSLEVDVNDRLLRRVFNNHTFDQGGRLFGYWPQYLRRTDRGLLSMDGEVLVDLDFASMFIGLLHVHAGKQFDRTRDPFELTGWEPYREQIKAATYAILNAGSRPRNFPEGLAKELPKGTRWVDLEEAVLSRVALVREFAYTQVGLKLMRMESDILVRALLDLVDKGVGFIPMHDGIMVPWSAKEVARTAMMEAYRGATGQEPVIKEKPF